MARNVTKFGGFALLLVLVEAPVLAQAPTDPGMSEDVRRMHEQLIVLSEGEGSLSDLRIELMEGGMAAHRSLHIGDGKLVSKEWTSPGSPVIQLEGNVADSRLIALIQQLIEKEYWSFEGTRFVPDAPVFLFRFFYADLKSVDFRCDADELEKSEARVAIRKLFLELVNGNEMRPVAPE